MMAKYDPKSIESKWQDIWERTSLFKVKEDPAKQKYYLLEVKEILPKEEYAFLLSPIGRAPLKVGSSWETSFT